MKTLLKNMMSMAAVIWLAAVPVTVAQEKKEGPPPAKAVSIFPDKNLEKAVRRHVFEKRDNNQPLTESDVERISGIEGVGMGITDLTGLEKCRELASLDLSKNQIRNIAALRSLSHLQSLNLADNQIEDITPLRDIAALQYVELSGNRVKDVSALAGLKNLRNLYLSRDAVRDIQPVTGLRDLVSLYLDGNPVASLRGIGSLPWLATLSLNDTGLSDLTGLDGVQNLHFLFLERNKLTDLAPLLEIVKRDAEGQKRFAPYLNLSVAGNPLSEAGKGSLEKIKALGVRVRE